MILKEKESVRHFFKLKKERVVAMSIGIVYTWFGVLKFFPEISPADTLAKKTISFISFGMIPDDISILILAILEVTIGLCLLLNYQVKTIVIIAILHLAMTFVPLLFFPEISFVKSPLVPTLVGQYIAKNIIIIGALFLIYPIKNRIA